MTGFSVIDLAKLPAPDVVEPLDFETILDSLKAELQARAPQFSAAVESDPVYKLLEVAAYRELLLRARINDASRSVMLAYARGSDLDNLAAFYGVTRQIISAGDPQAQPPVPPVVEDDERLRYRAQLSLESYSTAGPVGSYVFHALSASPKVRDVSVQSPSPGEVVVTVLSTEDDGRANADLLEQVRTRLNAEDVRPLTDQVTVQNAEILPYRIRAQLVFYTGPDPEVVRQESLRAATDYARRHHLLGHDITLSGLYAALHQVGVQKVVLTEPTSDIVVEPHQAAYATQVEVTAGGIGE